MLNQRERTNRKYNLDLYDINLVDGKYQIPIINNNQYIPERIIGFNYANTSKNYKVGIHFYIDDYQFERVWNNPDKYIGLLKKFQCVFSPDFSLYMDMPLSMKIWNVYRSRLIGQYWQKNGIKVIPTISWAEKETYDFCFDGIPKESIVSISTLGVKKSKNAIKTWKDGVDEMIKRINPSVILIYGEKIEHDFHGIPIIYYENEIINRVRERI